MKFAIPMYDGDSIIRRGPEAQNEAPEEVISGDSTPEMLQRKIHPSRAETETITVNTFELEREAGVLRTAAIGSALVRFWSWVERLFETGRRRRVEEYLARAQSVAELEARLRKLERGDHLVRM